MHADHSAPVFLLLLASAVSGFPQSAPVVTGAGYTLPAPVKVAPGQVLTIFVQGIGSGLTQPVRAPESTLPTSLAGISVTLEQGSDRPVGILDVRPVSTCAPLSAAGTGVFPQPVSNCGRRDGGDCSDSFRHRDHLFRLCGHTSIGVRSHRTLGFRERNQQRCFPAHGNRPGSNPCANELRHVPPRTPPPINYTGLPCSPMVTHVDGSLVSFGSPAQPGEEVVAYAVGLGSTQSCRGGRPTGAPRRRPPPSPSTCSSATCPTRCRRGPAGVMGRCSPGLPPDTMVCTRSIWLFPLLQRAHLRAVLWTRTPTAAGQQRGAVQSDGEHRRHVFIRRCRDLRGGPTVELPRPGVPATGYEWGSDCTSAEVQLYADSIECSVRQSCDIGFRRRGRQPEGRDSFRAIALPSAVKLRLAVAVHRKLDKSRHISETCQKSSDFPK